MEPAVGPSGRVTGVVEPAGISTTDGLRRTGKGCPFAASIAGCGSVVGTNSGPGPTPGKTTGAVGVPPPQTLLLSPTLSVERRRPLNTSRSKAPGRPWLT